MRRRFITSYSKAKTQWSYDLNLKPKWEGSEGSQYVTISEDFSELRKLVIRMAFEFGEVLREYSDMAKDLHLNGASIPAEFNLTIDGEKISDIYVTGAYLAGADALEVQICIYSNAYTIDGYLEPFYFHLYKYD